MKLGSSDDALEKLQWDNLEHRRGIFPSFYQFIYNYFVFNCDVVKRTARQSNYYSTKL